MSKIFGYSNREGKDWFKSDSYRDREIESIKDPEGGNEVTLPTAIPSPFARIDLVKKAFKNISKSSKLKYYQATGNVIASKEDEKIVSYTLDLAEMLFNFDSLKDNVKILIWDKEESINALNNGTDKQRKYADTLSLFLNQDKDSYNFDSLKRIYIIKWKHDVIGATSPSTLFFPTANDLSNCQIRITSNHLLFDNTYTALYERDPEFQIYFYYLFNSNPILKSRMKEVWEYLEKNLRVLSTHNSALYARINELNPTDYASIYSELNTGTNNSEIEIFGIGLRKRISKNVIEQISQKSDFRIKSSKYKGDFSPLVLQNDFNKSGWIYTMDTWSKFKVPFQNALPLDKRILPGLNIKYPYLTVGDFLEPKLIRLVYPMNSEKYFDGNLKYETGKEHQSYLLPLKTYFFDFFTADELVSGAPGMPRITMTQSAANSVRVTLSIPVAKNGEYISFDRVYYETGDFADFDTSENDTNKGTIVEHQFGLTIYPFIRTKSESIKPNYRIQLIDRDVVGALKHSDFSLQYFSSLYEDQVQSKAQKSRSRKLAGDVTSAKTQYYVLEEEFDFIQVSNKIMGGASGIVLPKWPIYQHGTVKFSFSVDFGTTNTHIEYRIAENPPKPFDIGKEDLQIATLFHPSKTSEDFGGSGAFVIRELIEYEFLPMMLGIEHESKFPHRTLISHSEYLDFKTGTFPLADFNIPFGYEQKNPRIEDSIESNLKWAKKDFNNEIKVRSYFEIIIFLLRNKVLLNRGNLADVKVVWFYPSSMKPARKSSLEYVWTELFHKHINPNSSPIGIPESLAPFFYYKGIGKIQGGIYSPVVSVDIGGGTTDVVVFQKNKPLLLTSFKFAANSIFGDGFNEHGSASMHGIIQKYKSLYENLFRTNNNNSWLSVLNLMVEKNRSEDICALLFSIENNSTHIDKNLYSFNKYLSEDDDLVILFIYFYSALIYHISTLMKINGIQLPSNIVFSGTGSKLLNIVTTDSKVLSKITRLIYESVYNISIDPAGMIVETEKSIPKEVTCKGGLMLDANDLEIDLTSIKRTLTCLEDHDINTLSYDELTSDNKENIIKYVERFNAFFLTLNDKYSFTDHFNVSNKSLDVFKEKINFQLRDYLENGIEFNRKLDDSNNDNKELEESLFFYPLIGTINNMTTLLSQLTPFK